MTATDKASVLIEALPYLQRFSGSTFLIKMGGSCMEDPDLVGPLMRDIVFLKVAGIHPIIVHGGGKRISAAMEEAGIKAQFVNGLRVTTDAAIDIVERTLGGVINPEIVAHINAHGGKAAGLPGTDVFMASRLESRDEHGRPADIGRVGKVESCAVEDVLYATTSNLIPVVSPLGREKGSGKALNINADLAAAALAKALKVRKLVYISDVPGLLRDFKNPDTLIHSVSQDQTKDLIKEGVIAGGMVPKVESAVDAIDAGVRKVHFIDGRMPHTLLLEIFTSEGIGTEITIS